MTKEELEKEATEYALEWGDKTDGTYACCRDGYLAGAEPREKRIAELEEELAISEHDREHNDYELTEVYKKVAELEKENAELKELKKKKEEIEIMIEFCKTCKQMHTDQLTKAKEIIKKLVDGIRVISDPKVELTDVDSFVAKAEQFLKDSGDK